jgi:hypothetical protein
MADGTFRNSNASQKKMFDQTIKIRFFRLITTREITNAFYSSIAEIGVIM